MPMSNAAITDTSALLAYFDSGEPDHASVAQVIDAATGPLIVSPYVIAELDYLVATRHGVEPEFRVLDELSSGAWELANFELEDIRQALSIIANHADQDIGIADASNVVLADRYGTDAIITLDHRHFDVVQTLDRKHFAVLPSP